MSVILEVRFPSEPDRQARTPGPFVGGYVGVRNTSPDHDVCFKFRGRIREMHPLQAEQHMQAGGETHLTLPAGDDSWYPIIGNALTSATVWAIRKPRDPMDDGMGGW